MKNTKSLDVLQRRLDDERLRRKERFHIPLNRALLLGRERAVRHGNPLLKNYRKEHPVFVWIAGHSFTPAIIWRNGRKFNRAYGMTGVPRHLIRQIRKTHGERRQRVITKKVVAATWTIVNL